MRSPSYFRRESTVTKPWYKSSAIKGALLAGLGALMSPQVLSILPPKIASGVVVVGAVTSAIGLRKALP